MADRYEIKGRIGRGGIGAVYQAYDHHLGRDVAIKRLLPMGETHLNDSAEKSLQSEALALASLSHPNIVTIFEFSEDEEGPYVVFELIDGDNLKDIIAEGALSENDFYEVADQILDALIAAQKEEILHRDIKPANIMLTWLSSGKFQIKMLDFGLSKFTEGPSVQTLDQKGSFLGSIDYVAPEQIELFPLDQRTDLYSLGCVLYFCLTQRSPFAGESMAETMNNHLAGKAVPLEDMRPDIPVAVCRWVMSLIALHPSERPDDAFNALESLIEARNTSNQSITDSIPTVKHVVPVITTAQPTGQSRELENTRQIVRTPAPKVPVVPAHPPPADTTGVVTGRYKPGETDPSYRKAIFGLAGAVAALLVVGLILADDLKNRKKPKPRSTLSTIGKDTTSPPEKPQEEIKNVDFKNGGKRPPLPKFPKAKQLVAYYSIGGLIQNRKGSAYRFGSGEQLGALENMAPGAHKHHLLVITPENPEKNPLIGSRWTNDRTIFCTPGQKLITSTKGGIKKQNITSNDFTFAFTFRVPPGITGPLFRASLTDTKGTNHNRAVHVSFTPNDLQISSNKRSVKAKVKLNADQYCSVFAELSNGKLTLWQKARENADITGGKSIPVKFPGPYRLGQYEWGYFYVPGNLKAIKRIEIQALTIHTSILSNDEKKKLASCLFESAALKN